MGLVSFFIYYWRKYNTLKTTIYSIQKNILKEMIRGLGIYPEVLSRDVGVWASITVISPCMQAAYYDHGVITACGEKCRKHNII